MIDSPAALVLLLSAIVAAPLFIRRLRQPTSAGVKVLSRTALTKSSAVAVISIDDRRWLVGTGEGGVRLLTELDRDEQLNHPAATPAVTSNLLEPNQDASLPRPWTGLIDRLREQTVRADAARSRHAPHGP